MALFSTDTPTERLNVAICAPSAFLFVSGFWSWLLNEPYYVGMVFAPLTAVAMVVVAALALDLSDWVRGKS